MGSTTIKRKIPRKHLLALVLWYLTNMLWLTDKRSYLDQLTGGNMIFMNNTRFLFHFLKPAENVINSLRMVVSLKLSLRQRDQWQSGAVTTWGLGTIIHYNNRMSHTWLAHYLGHKSYNTILTQINDRCLYTALLHPNPTSHSTSHSHYFALNIVPYLYCIICTLTCKLLCLLYSLFLSYYFSVKCTLLQVYLLNV